MKRFLLSVVAVCIILCSILSLNSCELIFGNSNDINNNNNNNNNNIGDQNNRPDDYVPNCTDGDHIDDDQNLFCDLCDKYVIVVIDFYVINDLHGKFCDTETQPGVDELATYLKNMEASDDNVVFMSTGDMWQGTAESNLTGGVILTEWMNQMNFVSMTLGNHEYDWGEAAIRNNLQVAEFPFLAINVYDVNTGKLADYCTPSIMIERDGVKIGIIGALGDCYSSISSDMVTGVRFKVGSELTALVKAESQKLREAGADLIVFSLHDGMENYDTALSNGYVDICFEAHTHQQYVKTDNKGIYHLQGGGENGGICHAEIQVNSASGANKVNQANFVSTSNYKSLADDPATEELEEKYRDVIDFAYSDLGVVSRKYSDSEVEDYVASLYLKAGIEKWGEDYDIVLGGGFLKTRSPYDLDPGATTYADILSLLPFDNRIVLCSVSGQNLLSRFVNTSNSDYHTAYSEYGSSIIDNISASGTYYIVVDTYTALYRYNGLTIVDFYDDTTFARDLFAEAVKNGDFEIKTDNYILTSIPDALAMGSKLGNNQATMEAYYIKGTITSISNAASGILYIEDEDGNQIYVYRLYDTAGKQFGYMSNKPAVGDTIVVYSTVYKFYYNGSTTIELKDGVIIDVE